MVLLETMAYKRRAYRKKHAKAHKGRRRAKPTTTRAVARIAARVVQKQHEIKQLVNVPSTTSLLSNQINYLSPTQNIAVGTTSSTRVGDSIFLRHVKFRGLLRTLTSYPYIRYRVFAVWLDIDAPAQSFSNGNIISTDLFLSSGTTSVNAMWNNKKTNRVVFDKTYTTRLNGVGEYPFSGDIRVMQKKTFKPGGGPYYFKDHNLYIGVVCDAPNATPGVTSVASALWMDTLITYTDS